MSIQMNQSLSVDCAVFGFNGKSLKVLLIERRSSFRCIGLTRDRRNVSAPACG